MRVPPYNYPLDDHLIKKLDLMINRCTQKTPKKDAVLLFEGAEGEGKTTFSVAAAYYIKYKTGREFNHKHVYFDLNEMIKALQETEGQIAIWDEPALQAMSKDALTTLVKDLERLLLMARKKRHFLIINIAYFNKFSDYIIWQRPLGMVHVYSRKEVESGRYVYIKKKALELLYREWRSRKYRAYKKYCSKYIRGTFPDVLNPDYKNNVLSDFDVDAYEKRKDQAIMMIGKSKDKSNVDPSNPANLLNLYKVKMCTLEFPIKSVTDLSKQMFGSNTALSVAREKYGLEILEQEHYEKKRREAFVAKLREKMKEIDINTQEQ